MRLLVRETANMENEVRLSLKWIDDAMADVESSASTVLVIETADPRREGQLVDYLLTNFSHVFRYHPWSGLEEADRSQGRFVPVTLSAGSGYEPGLQNECRELGGALRHMDRLLREQERTALVLRGLERPGDGLDRNADLVHALRAWAVSGEIMASKSVICLVSSSPLAAIDQTTLDRASLVRPELASYDERLDIVRKTTRQARMQIDEDRQRAIALATAGLNLHQTQCVLLKTYHTTRAFRADTVKEFKADHIRRSDVLEIEEPQVTFDDVGGYDAVKKLVTGALIRPLEKSEQARRLALPLPRGILLYGPPGTGKTLFAKALAGQISLPFINLRTENLFSKYLGESGQRVRDAVRLIEQASPSLVFIDEIDRFGRRTSSGDDGASQETMRVFSQVLEWLGDKKRQSIIVGTTNVPNHLDPAFIRPGRFDTYVPFLYPDFAARQQILLAHLGLQGTRPRPAMDEQSIRQAVVEVAHHTEFYAGADLELLVTRAKQKAFEANCTAMTGVHLLAAHRDYCVEVDARKSLENEYRALGPVFANSLDLLAGTGRTVA
jgi:ATP-dependent 26S proteasome regulatory subunit